MPDHGWYSGQVEEGIDVGEEGLEENRATKIAGGLEFVRDARADECGHSFIECVTEFAGREVIGFLVDAGEGEGFREAGDGGEERHPIDPTWKGALPVRWRRKQEPPFLGTDTEVLLAAVADGDYLGGILHPIEGLLDGLGEIAGGSGDGGGVAGLVGKELGHDFRPGVDAEECPQGEEQVLPFPGLR
jgi:hypothetical protein